jgi:hypothetical protein
VTYVYDFSKDAEKVRWLKMAFKPHANAMLDRWQEKDRLKIGVAKAKEKRQELIRKAESNE